MRLNNHKPPAQAHVTRGALIFALSLLLLACNSSEPPSAIGKAGTTSEVTYENTSGRFRALVYTPANYDPKKPAPLVVMVHGCNTTAEQQQKANLFEPLADREGFLVAYPDHDTPSITSAGTHPLQCWRYYDPTELQRGGSDADGITGLTGVVMQNWAVDAERVYLIGMSSGGLITSLVGASYPDLYAAIGVAAGGGYGGALSIAGEGLPSIPPETLAQMAYRAMDTHARVVPFLNFHGDADGTVPPATGDKAVTLWLMTNNLVASGTTAGPFPLTPTDSRIETVPGGRSYDDLRFHDAEGCLISRQIRIHGMNHFWPGGTTEPQYAEFTDPSAPSGAEISWDFFRRFTKSGTALPCVETR